MNRKLHFTHITIKLQIKHQSHYRHTVTTIPIIKTSVVNAIPNINILKSTVGNQKSVTIVTEKDTSSNIFSPTPKVQDTENHRTIFDAHTAKLMVTQKKMYEQGNRPVEKQHEY